MLSLHALTGTAANAYIEQLARLRIAVFREFPYLYDGDMAYEASYLQGYITCCDNIIIVAKDGDKVVGASSGMPLIHAADDVKQAFAQHNFTLSSVFYCGESVLLPSYRGKGIGAQFIQLRERHARQLGGFSYSCFCAVQRGDHPDKPADYVPLDRFWQRHGYVKHDDLQARFSWKDIGHNHETIKTMSFWLKDLTL